MGLHDEREVTMSTRQIAGRFALTMGLGITLGACTDDHALGPDSAAGVERAGAPTVSVLTWNVYVGARLENLLAVEDPMTIPFQVAGVFADVQATSFPERAEVIADRIVSLRPHVVALQEVSLFRIQSPGDFLAGNPIEATDAVLDFLQILHDALAARGANYDVAATSQNFNIELPIYNPATGLDDIRLTDFDVLLVRADVAWSNPQHGHFGAALPIELGGQTLYKQSGWASADIVVKGLPYHVATTHLEAADFADGQVNPELEGLQLLQASELLEIMSAWPDPVILTGDLNSAADGSSTATYGLVRDAGFVDTWNVGPPRGRGYTSNQAPDLRNAASELFHRIDYVLYRDVESQGSSSFHGSVHAELIGEEPGDRTPGGLWPSDHAGVYTELRPAPGLGLR
jgi:endonuclease/exonuclease/phosphatase family metal-dependent hydrolase